MKRIITFLLISFYAAQLLAQDDSTKVKASDNNGVEVMIDNWGDTTKVRIGSRTFKVIEDDRGTHVKVGKERMEKKWAGHFNAHWAGVEMGINTFQKTDYSLYNNNPFMELNHGKSLTVNLNFAEWAFRNEANNFALVTGAGFSFMDFTFDNPVTVAKYNGRIEPVDLNPEGLKKSKLTATYFTVPMMLELKTPLKLNGTRVYLGAGVIGGLNISAHTKYKYDKDKYKDRGNYYLNQFKYDVTGRIGFGDFCIFVNYSMTPLFKENKGPELYPLTFGISFPNI